VEDETGADFEYRSLPPLELKGKARQFRAFELLSTTEQRHRSRDDGITPIQKFVGRAAPMSALDEALDAVSAGSGQIVSLVGDAGIGKSRILAEFRSRTSEKPLTWLVGRSLAAGRNLAFHPFADLLRTWARIDSANKANEASSSFDELDRALSAIFGDESDEILPILAALAGVRTPDEVSARISSIDGKAMERLVFKSVRQLLAQLTKDAPLVLVLEDLHWADGSSLELLESLFSLATQSRILFLLAYRPDYPESAGVIREILSRDHPTRHHPIELGPLDDSASADLLADFLRAGEVAPSLRKLISTRASGNPFYLGEIIRSLVDAGALVHEDLGLTATSDRGTIDVPGTIRDVILYRLDRLAAGPKAVLQSAAVIGARVRFDALRQVMSDDSQLSEHLEDLVRSQHLNRADEQHATEYAFGHPLIEEVAYASIPRRQRRSLHLEVARAIEHSPKEADASDALLAYHYGLGGDEVRAEEYLFRAGEEAARVAGSREALHFFQQASEAYFAREPGGDADFEKRRSLEKNLAFAYFNRGDLIDAVEHFNRVLELSGERVPRKRAEMLAIFLRTMSVILAEPYLPDRAAKRPAATDVDREIIDVMFNRARAETTADTAAFLFHGLDTVRKLRRVDPTTVPGAGGMLASACGMFSISGISFAIGGRFLDRGRLLVDPADANEVALFGLMNFFHNMLVGNWGSEHELPEEAIERALQLGQLWDITNYLGLYAKRCAHQGRFDDAERGIRRLAEIAEDYDFAPARQNHGSASTFFYLERGELQEAHVAATAYTTTMDEDPPRVFALGLDAKILIRMGELEGAEERIERAEALVAQIGIVPLFQMSTLRGARFMLDLDRLERATADDDGAGARRLGRRALRSGKRAVRMANKVASKRVETYRLFGHCHWLLGRQGSAFAWWHRSIEAGESLGAQPQLARTYLEVADRLTEAGSERRFRGQTAEALRTEGRAALASLEKPAD
jgi:tetratricopeptide (TPR) repeat protein